MVDFSMPGKIPEHVLEEILSRIDIVELIGSYIPLKKAGRNFKALCPFHREKTSSFMVSPDKQIFHCFGCAASGNAFAFLMRHERMEFLEAVKFCARKAGVQLPDTYSFDQKTDGVHSRILAINEAAADFFAQNLLQPFGKKAFEYLISRGLSQAVIKDFKIGLARDSWDAISIFLRSKGFSLMEIEKSGLIMPRESGGYYDRFRNRIMFAVRDVQGKIVGFGARVMDQSLPKYINSPETPVYTKGKHVFGLHVAKEAIKDTDCVIIVEGYMDFLVPYQAGVCNIVASLGTALTDEQVRLLRRFTHNAVLLYDADAAGQAASLRSLDIFIEEEMDVKVAPLPKGYDPDSFLRAKGKDQFDALIKNALDVFEYKFQALSALFNAHEVSGKAKICSGMLEMIARFKNEVVRSEYIKQLSQRLGVREEALQLELKKNKTHKVPVLFAAESKQQVLAAINPTEKLLIKLMLEEDVFIHQVKEHLKPHDFSSLWAKQLVELLFNLVSEGKKIEPNILMSIFDDQKVGSFVCESIFSQDYCTQNKETIVADCIRRLKSDRKITRRKQIQDEILLAEKSGDENRLNRLKEEFCTLTKKEVVK